MMGRSFGSCFRAALTVLRTPVYFGPMKRPDRSVCSGLAVAVSTTTINRKCVPSG